MGSAGARRGRPRRRRGRAAARRRRTRRPDRPRRSRSEGAGPSCGRSLGRALLGEELLVELERVGELLRQLRLRVDRVDRARLDARVAVDADLGIDVELLRRLEVAGARLGVDAVDRTHLDAGVVLDAAADDDVGHGPTGYKPSKPGPLSPYSALMAGGSRSDPFAALAAAERGLLRPAPLPDRVEPM